MMKVALLLAVPALATANVIKLATFDGAEGTTYKWRETNDPVMGGQSFGTFSVDDASSTGIFNGTCKIVPKLKAPGFCNAQSTKKQYYNDASSLFESGTFQLYARTTTPEFEGYRVAFGAKDVPKTGFGSGSFKSGFQMTGTDWQVVQVPFDSFSWDWSGYTGRCDTKDPGGKQHYCCNHVNQTQYCPTEANLGTVEHLEVWAEGAQGDYHLEIQWIGVGEQTA